VTFLRFTNQHRFTAAFYEERMSYSLKLTDAIKGNELGTARLTGERDRIAMEIVKLSERRSLLNAEIIARNDLQRAMVSLQNCWLADKTMKFVYEG
jgi:hypothetical protein